MPSTSRRAACPAPAPSCWRRARRSAAGSSSCPRSRRKMTIRKKIFLLAGILLALFGVVVGALAIIQKLDSDEIGNIVDYQLPLSLLVCQLDVGTDQYA